MAFGALLGVEGFGVGGIGAQGQTREERHGQYQHFFHGLTIRAL
jgi:hypothetical protein